MSDPRAAAATTQQSNDIPLTESPKSAMDQPPLITKSAANGTSVPITQVDGNSGEDETKPRHSTPESDVVASSDDEQDHGKVGLFPPKHSAVSQLSSRRPSYAAEFHTRQRTYSISGGGPLSPTTSHPNTPSGDTAAWAAGISAGVGLGGTGGSATLGSFWAGSIWNSEPSRKSPPKQLNVAPPMGGGGNPSPLFAGIEALPSPTTLPASNSEFPIPIPLQPQFRNYRSMSFSVGQMDPEDQNRSRLSPPSLHGSRPPQAGLQHRPSRPSLLSEEQFPTSSSPLRSVFEAEDDNARAGDGSTQPTSGGYFQPHMSGFPRAKYGSMGSRNRSASAATIQTLGLASSSLGFGPKDGERIDESALAEDEDIDLAQFQAEQRRFSEVPRPVSLAYNSPSESQRMENLRRHHWTSASNGFLQGDAGTQSRRHSIAGGPTLTDTGETELGFGSGLLAKRSIGAGESGLGLRNGGNNHPSLADASKFDPARRDPLYLSEENRLRARQTFPTTKQSALGPSPATPPTQLPLSQMQAFAPGRTSPPGAAHRSVMSLSMHAQPRSQQLLYFVTFKACRGDVFYVQEGTGLRVRVGDLVIVEADRGTDLGTVIAENITWQRAKELKEQYTKEQYTVLMMYASRRPAATGPQAPNGPPALNGMPGQSPGFSNGAGPSGLLPHGQSQGQDNPAAELKPKMIKRLAQPHEIQTLRDKEANEAKAKRVCQQKVSEHRLPMEILDAEFQMDWKKLTFYYFADSYINFNSLVTDLFKVYKTRIWMSAMNPASFAHPTGIHPSNHGPPSSALGSIGEAPTDPLHPHFPGMGQAYTGYQATTAAPTNALSAPRGLTQSNNVGFPSRHSPHSNSAQDFNNLVPQPEYNAYANGVSGIPPTQQVLFNGENHGPNGANTVWMGLPGLSLNSH